MFSDVGGGHKKLKINLYTLLCVATEVSGLFSA
jgi:hypothetical protein